MLVAAAAIGPAPAPAPGVTASRATLLDRPAELQPLRRDRPAGLEQPIVRAADVAAAAAAKPAVDAATQRALVSLDRGGIPLRVNVNVGAAAGYNASGLRLGPCCGRYGGGYTYRGGRGLFRR
jgi:hypothetical protein